MTPRNEPSVAVRYTFALTLLAGLHLGLASSCQARPVHKEALADYFGPFLARKLNDCRTCHLPDKPGEPKEGQAADKPHNPFGARLAEVKDQLRQAGKKTDLASRLEAIADEDNDGDGVSNLIELLTGHVPGEAADKPTAAEVAESRNTLAAFRKYRATYYPWKPFETVKRPAVPAVKNSAWVRNPIDAFIAAEHESRGLTPRPEASKPVLLRRVYLDLTGLPPTPDELHAFLADTSADAYEKVVDRLLASPRYGERWGRHWMDVWRYSDWDGWTGGNQIRDSQPHIWRWRDWIIESLNQDKGYDRMVLEMLAADELAPTDTNALRATGYLVRNYKMLSREKWLQDTVDHTAQAFLGVTLGCARCHDHMYDPIRQEEYYRVRAIFEPHHVRIDQVPGQPDTKLDGLVRAYDANPQVKTFVFTRGDERTPEKEPLTPGVPEALGGRFPAVETVSLPAAAYAPDKRDFVIQEQLARSQGALSKAREALPAAQRQAVAGVIGLLDSHALAMVTPLNVAQQSFDAAALADLSVQIAQGRHETLLRVVRAEKLEDEGRKGSEEWKQAATEADKVQRQLFVLEGRLNVLTNQQLLRNATGTAKTQALTALATTQANLTKAIERAKQPPSVNYVARTTRTYPQRSTGRRLAFARWIADKDNPLTARVAMNHIWLRHFGRAIVPRVFDFGKNGQRPTHPALLDWLAAEFHEQNWSMKAMHRLLLTSSTYRMASTPDTANLALDRDNLYLWRMASRRIEAEVVRDCLFYVAGQLDLTMGGPDIDQNQGLTLPRRSIYFRHAQEKQMEFLKIFDCAAVTECYQRKESILPQQALALANSEVSLKHARLLARSLATRAGADPAAFTTAAFEQVLARPATAEELAECAAFLKQQAQRYSESKPPAAADPALRARENLVHVLLNHHDFVTVR